MKRDDKNGQSNVRNCEDVRICGRDGQGHQKRAQQRDASAKCHHKNHASELKEHFKITIKVIIQRIMRITKFSKGTLFLEYIFTLALSSPNLYPSGYELPIALMIKAGMSGMSAREK